VNIATKNLISVEINSPSDACQSSIPTLEEILTADPDRFVAKYTDIAAVNLACARGLPNCDDGEFPKYLALLDTIAEAVRQQTERNWRLFKLKPAQFNNSENVYRLYTMEHVFRVQFNIRYDPIVRDATQNGEPWMSDDSSELFIHGLLSTKRTGTCSSLPTFAIAVGRRLGYPLKLILVPKHTLYRWDDGKEIFNLQPTEAGGEVKPDDYFHDWPRKWDENARQMNERTKVWLCSLTPKKEVSKFLCNRALMLRDIGRYEEAFQALKSAERFDPINPACSEIWFSVEYAMNGGNVPALLTGKAHQLNYGLISLAMPAWSKFGATALSIGGQLLPNSFVPQEDPPSKTTDKQSRVGLDFALKSALLAKLLNDANKNALGKNSAAHRPRDSIQPLIRKLTEELLKPKGRGQ
jgi:hypothetical protein